MKYSVMLYPKFEFIRHGQSRLVSFARVRDHLLSGEIAIQLFYVLLFKCILKLVLFPTGLRVLLKKVPKAMIKMLSFHFGARFDSFPSGLCCAGAMILFIIPGFCSFDRANQMLIETTALI